MVDTGLKKFDRSTRKKTHPLEEKWFNHGKLKNDLKRMERSNYFLMYIISSQTKITTTRWIESNFFFMVFTVIIFLAMNIITNLRNEHSARSHEDRIVNCRGIHSQMALCKNWKSETNWFWILSLWKCSILFKFTKGIPILFESYHQNNDHTFSQEFNHQMRLV